MKRRNWRYVAVAVAILGASGGGATLWMAHAAGESVLSTIDTSHAGQPASAVVDERANRALFAGFDRGVSLVDTRDGELVRAIGVGAPARLHTLAVATRAGHAFVVSMGRQGSPGVPPGSSTVSMIDTRGGAVLRTTTLGIEAGPVAVDEITGYVFVAATGPTKRDGTPRGPGAVSMIDARSGALVHTVAVGLGPTAIAVDGRTGRAFVLNGQSDSVSVVDTSSGTVRRTVRVGRNPLAAAVDEVTGRVFVTSPGGWPAPGTVSVLDARTGHVLKTVTVGWSADTVAVDARTGHVFLTGDRVVSMLDATSGAVLATIPVGGNPFAVAVDTRTGRAFITGTDGGVFAAIHHIAPGSPPEWAGYIAVLDTRSGAPLRTVRVGRDPRGVVVDERAGHAFVANFWGSSVSMLDAAR